MTAPIKVDGRALEAYACAVPGRPGPAKVNCRTTTIRVGKSLRVVLSADYRRWKAAAVLLFRRAAEGRSFGPGPLVATVTAYWPRQHRTGAAAGLAMGDVDAIAKAVLDAGETAGVYADDAQIVELTLRKRVDATRPRIEVVVRRLELEGEPS